MLGMWLRFQDGTGGAYADKAKAEDQGQVDARSQIIRNGGYNSYILRLGCTTTACTLSHFCASFITRLFVSNYDFTATCPEFRLITLDAI